MLFRKAILLIATLESINVLAVPIAQDIAGLIAREEKREEFPVEFVGAQYSRLYKEAEEEGLAEREKKREQKREEFPVEFVGAQYSRLYKEAEEEGLTKREAPAKRDKSVVQFAHASYAPLYKEAEDAGLTK